MTVQAPARTQRRVTSPFEPITTIHLAPLPAGHREEGCQCSPIRSSIGSGFLVIHRTAVDDPFARPIEPRP